MVESFEESILDIDCVDVEGKTDKTAKFQGKNYLRSTDSLEVDGTGTTEDPTDMGFEICP